jgi:hypothetical protein
MDLAGNIFVADWGNNAIRIISTNGIVSTYAGTVHAIGPTVTFLQPVGLTQDSFGNIVVSTFDRIFKIKNVFYSTAKVSSTIARYLASIIIVIKLSIVTNCESKDYILY